MQMAESPMDAPPAYVLDKEDTLNPHWWDFRYWEWKQFLALGAGVVIVIIIVVIAAVEVTKANRYPIYSKLDYSLEDTCALSQSFRDILC